MTSRSKTPARLSRRRVLIGVAIAGTGAIAGCLDDDDGDDGDGGALSPDETPTPGDSPEDTPPDDDDHDDDDPDEDSDDDLDVVFDVDTYASDLEVTYTFEDGEVMTYTVEQRFDRERNRRYEHFEFEGGEEGPFEIVVVHIEGTRYQVMGGQCTQVDDLPIDFDDDFVFEDPDDVDDEAHDFTRVGDDTIDGEPVEVWEYTLDEEEMSGLYTIYIATDTRRVLLMTADFEYVDPEEGTVHVDYRHRFHSFDEAQDIEVPEGC